MWQQRRAYISTFCKASKVESVSAYNCAHFGKGNHWYTYIWMVLFCVKKPYMCTELNWIELKWFIPVRKGYVTREVFPMIMLPFPKHFITDGNCVIFTCNSFMFSLLVYMCVCVCVCQCIYIHTYWTIHIHINVQLERYPVEELLVANLSAQSWTRLKSLPDVSVTTYTGEPT